MEQENKNIELTVEQEKRLNELSASLSLKIKDALLQWNEEQKPKFELNEEAVISTHIFAFWAAGEAVMSGISLDGFLNHCETQYKIASKDLENFAIETFMQKVLGSRKE